MRQLRANREMEFAEPAREHRECEERRTQREDAVSDGERSIDTEYRGQQQTAEYQQTGAGESAFDPKAGRRHRAEHQVERPPHGASRSSKLERVQRAGYRR